MFRIFLLLFISYGLLISCASSRQLKPKTSEPQKEGENDEAGVGSSAGDFVVIDGEVYHLADLFLTRYSNNKLVIDGRMLRQISNLEVELQKWDLPIAEFVNRQVTNDLVEFKLVAEIPKECRGTLGFEVSGEEAQVGCTRGFVTWIVPKYFSKLPQNEKMALLLHERLHAWAPQQPHDVIMPFVKGLLTFQSILDRGEYLAQPEDLEDLKNLRRSAAQLDFAPSKAWIVQTHGGLIDSRSKVDESAIIDIHSKVTASEVGANTKMVDSIANFSQISPLAEIHRSTLMGEEAGKVYVGMSSKIYDTSLSPNRKSETLETGTIVIGAFSELSKTSVNFSLRTGTYCRITNSSLIGPTEDKEFILGDRVQIENSYLDVGVLDIGEDSQILSSFLGGAGIIPVQTQIQEQKCQIDENFEIHEDCQTNQLK